MYNKLVRGFCLFLSCVMLIVSGVGEVEVRAENVQPQEESMNQEEESPKLEKKELEDGKPEGESPEGEEPGEQNPDGQEPENPEKQEQILSTSEEINITIADSYQIEIEQDGDGELSYESKDELVAAVDENGLITALSAGETSIIVRAAETDTYKSAELEIIVKVEKKEREVSVEDIEFVYGDEARQVILEGSVEGEVLYTIEDTTIAEVDSEGYVKPLKVGETKLLITIAENEEYKAAECECNILVKTTLQPPVLVKAVGSKGKITINWKKTEGAEGYYLYEKIGSGKYKLIATIDNPDTISYTKGSVAAGKLYYYQLEAFTDNGLNYSERSNTKSAAYLTIPSVEVKRIVNTVQVRWAQVTGASGYHVYRKTDKDRSWRLAATVSSGTTVVWTDAKPVQGMNDYYCVKAYYNDSLSDSSAASSVYHLQSPTIKSCTKKKKSKTMTVKWNRNTSASGYQIQYADNRLFHSAKTVTIKSNKTVSKKIKKLSKTKTYYVRIRAYKTVSGKKYYSDWTLSSNAKKTKTASYKLQKYKKKTFELKGRAKQSLGGYDTVQGGCSDGKYAYYALYNRKVEKCKIVKVKLSNMKVTKVSGILEIAHGNDMTYNSKTKRVIVTHTKVNTKRISIINPSSLRIERTFDVKIPEKMRGVSDKELKKMKGFAGIAYNKKRNQYVTFLNSTGDLMILDSNFNPVSYIKPSSKSSLTKQGIDAMDDYILISYSGSTNIIMVYTWEGQYVTRINVKKGYEIENIFHVGKQYYATFYRSYYKNKKLKRDNYVYKISSF